MLHCHLIRLGIMGQVGHFFASDAERYPRHCRVVVRTSRGIYLGKVLAALVDASPSMHRSSHEESVQLGTFDGQILRQMTAADRLTESRLEGWRQDAYTACARFLHEHYLPALLVDVEFAFDGQTLIFHFLGDVAPELETHVSQIAQSYGAESYLGPFNPQAASAIDQCDGCTCPNRGRCGESDTDDLLDAHGSSQMAVAEEGRVVCAGCSGCVQNSGAGF